MLTTLVIEPRMTCFSTVVVVRPARLPRPSKTIFEVLIGSDSGARYSSSLGCLGPGKSGKLARCFGEFGTLRGVTYRHMKALLDHHGTNDLADDQTI